MKLKLLTDNDTVLNFESWAQKIIFTIQFYSNGLRHNYYYYLFNQIPTKLNY